MVLSDLPAVQSSPVVNKTDGYQTERERADDNRSRRALYPIGRRRLEIDFLETPQNVVFGCLVVIDDRRLWKESGDD